MRTKIIPRYVRIKYGNINRQNLHIAYPVLTTAVGALHLKKSALVLKQAYEVGMIISLPQKEEIEIKQHCPRSHSL